ncbi:hypothetical protein R50073_24420 [Maricurvus nonylphenolicus]|uniref:phage tail tape measure protein n=1 Tax=Maricurvus nonylphenolicus TaxID=1008307 RepID=UPI0036F443AF
MSNELKLNVLLGADRFLGPANKVAKVGDKMADALSRGTAELNAIGKNRNVVANLKRIQPQLDATKNKLNAQRESTRKLHQEINSGGKITRAQRREYNASRNALERLEKRYQSQRQQLAGYNNKAKEAGINTRNLADEQNKLADAYGRVEKRMQGIAKAQATVDAAQSRHDNALQRAANASLVAGGLNRVGHGLKNALSSPMQRSIEFETAITEVDKFVKGGHLPTLKKQILDLGKVSPLGATGIAQLVAAGGKINLPADQALEFAKVTEKLSVAFGISVDEASDSITTIRTGMNLNMAQIGQLGDAINFIGDSSSSNAANITDILSRAGSLGQNAGLKSPQVAALAAIIDGAAPSSEVAATSMKNMLSALTSGDAASKEQTEVLNSLGLDPVSLAQAMQANAAGTIAEVLNAIRDQDAAVRGSVIETLFGRESMAAVSNMVGNIEEYQRVMALAADTTKMSGSVENEYARTAKTRAYKLAVLRNRWEAILIRLGDRLLPVLDSVTTTLAPVIDGIGSWIEKHPTLAKWLIIGTGAIGALALAVAPVITAIASLGAAITWLGLRSRQAALDAALGGAAGGVGGKGGKGRLSRMLGGKLGIAGAVGLGALSIADVSTSSNLTGVQKATSIAGDVGGIAGAVGGAKVGAMLGAVGGPIGMAIGGLLGSIVGGIGGNMLASAGSQKIASLVEGGDLKQAGAGLAMATAAAVPVVGTPGAMGNSFTMAEGAVTIQVDGTGKDSHEIATMVRREIEAIEWEQQVAQRSNLHDND